MRNSSFALILLVVAPVWGPALAEPPDDGRTAPLLEGYPRHPFEATIRDETARRYFEQGLVLAYAFNHAEAGRSFAEAFRRDPRCAMCAWGEALVLGPNPNTTMDAEAAPKAWEALSRARGLAPEVTPREQDYIEALAHRYAAEPPEDRSALDQAYADAMRELYQRHRDDPDAATLYAEALMITTPWDYWEEDGSPKPVTLELLAALEQAMSLRQDHPGANHLYIHAVESMHPRWAVAHADRLGAVVPGAGHLVHMPSHIYIRVGRYDDALGANERAIAADQDYLTQCHAQGVYPLAYVPHNHHFAYFAAVMAGDAERALEAADYMARHTDRDTMQERGLETLQHYWMTPLYARVRFERWDEILAIPRPEPDLLYPRGVWHYARGLAYAAHGELEAAAAELDALRAVASDPGLAEVAIWDLNGSADLLEIASHILAGQIAAARGDFDTAVGTLRAGAAREDALRYDEPPPWDNPVRPILGRVLLAAGAPYEAERVFLEDLDRFPDNRWSRAGLEAARKAQGRPGS